MEINAAFACNDKKCRNAEIILNIDHAHAGMKMGSIIVYNDCSNCDQCQQPYCKRNNHRQCIYCKVNCIR